MHPGNTAQNVAQLCNLEDSAFLEVVERTGGDWFKSEDHPPALVDYYAMLELAMADLTVAENLTALENSLDVDNYFLYCILEIYASNNDWPYNNYKVWRYVNPNTDESLSNPYADGRWRFIFYDLDTAFCAPDRFPDGFYHVFEESEDMGLLIDLLQYEPYRIRFINMWGVLMGTALSYKHTSSVISSTLMLFSKKCFMLTLHLRNLILLFMKNI